MALEKQWKPFSLTHITYQAKDSLPEKILPFLLALLSLTPPFVVCALTTSTLIHKNVIAAYLLVGSISSSIITSILKRIIQQPRPPRYDDDVGDEVDYGMPSNHSSFAFFCASFVILYILCGGSVWALRSLPSYSIHHGSQTMNGNGDASISSCNNRASLDLLSRVWHHVHTTLTVFVSLSIATGCAYSRVYLGYHTTNQVIVGSFIGMLLGSMWYGLFEMEFVRGFLVQLDSTIVGLEMRRRRDMMCAGDDLSTKKKH